MHVYQTLHSLAQTVTSEFQIRNVHGFADGDADALGPVVPHDLLAVVRLPAGPGATCAERITRTYTEDTLKETPLTSLDPVDHNRTEIDSQYFA